MIIDVSQWQGSINWPAVKAAGIQLAIMKATEGVGFTDPRFAENWAGAKAAGVPRGAYHFARPDTGNDPLAEAAWFLSVVQPEAGDVLADDYEVSGGGATWNLAWLGYVNSHAANPLFFYSNYDGVSRVQDARMAQYALWLAYPGDGVNPPLAPWPWSAIELWQYGVGSISGISGNVDEDVPVGLFGPGGGSLTGDDEFMALIDNPTDAQKAAFADFLLHWPNDSVTIGRIFWALGISQPADASQSRSATLAGIAATLASLQASAGSSLTPTQAQQLSDVQAAVGRIEAALKGA